MPPSPDIDSRQHADETIAAVRAQTPEALKPTQPSYSSSSGDWFRDLTNFVAGWGDTLSFGLTSRLRGDLGIDAVDYDSGAYAAGSTVGSIHFSLMVFSGGGAGSAFRALQAVQITGGLVAAGESFTAGDIMGGLSHLMSVGLSAGIGLTGCQIGNAIVTNALKVMNLVNIGTMVTSGLTRLAEGDLFGAFADFLSAGASLYSIGQLSKACFPVDMEAITKRGWVRWDELKEGDDIGACDENDPSGPIVWKHIGDVRDICPALARASRRRQRPSDDA